MPGWLCSVRAERVPLWVCGAWGWVEERPPGTAVPGRGDFRGRCLAGFCTAVVSEVSELLAADWAAGKEALGLRLNLGLNLSSAS